ncbi:MAG TPA: hypothetical protein VF502_18715 [Stellaceae bacterium]
MRVFILTIALTALALPAFADCSPTHQAAKSDTVVTTSTPSTPAPTPSSGG